MKIKTSNDTDYNNIYILKKLSIQDKILKCIININIIDHYNYIKYYHWRRDKHTLPQ